MNLCLVSREYPPFFGGGIGTYTVRWSQALATAGHRVVVVTVSDDGTTRRERRGDLTVVRLPFIRGNDWSGPHPAIATPEARAAFGTFSPVSVLAMQIAAAAPSLHEEFAFDAIEFPDTGALGWFLLNDRRTGRIWARGGPPIVIAVHSPTEWIAHWNRAPLGTRAGFELAAMEEDCIRWSDGLVAPSNAMAQWVRDRHGLNEEAIRVVPYALGELESTAQACANATPAPDHPARRIVFAGRLEPRKGIDTLLEGLSLAVGRGADLTLDLAGEDPLQSGGRGRFGQPLLDHLPPALRARVTHHGRLEPELLARLQGAADVIAVPAPMDNFPFTCVEAMAQGRLIVAAAAGGMADLIRDGREGLLFRPGDSRSCADALARAASLDSLTRQTIGCAAAARVLDLCNNQTIVSRRLEHARSARVPRPAPRPVRRWITIDRSQASDQAIQRLREAAESANADFAHGWTRNGTDDVTAFSTPRTDVLIRSSSRVGPLVVDADLAAHPAIARLLEGGALEGRAFDAALALLATSATGAVVPDVITRSDQLGTSAADQAHRAALLDAELAGIHRSRGWRALERVYDVLHILRGRGLKRR
jgi:glycosyltransferase involved in cell wall biosynthesis